MYANQDAISLEPLHYTVGHKETLYKSCEASATDHIKMLIAKEGSKIYSIGEERFCYYDDKDISRPSGDRVIMNYMQRLSMNHSIDNSTFSASHKECRKEIDKFSQLMQERYSIEQIYRLRMSDWCYKICDFIGASRYIVDTAFNFLDRFLAIEKYSCDSAFDYKVASITCLLIALKVYNRKTVKPGALANLSNKEITVNDILTMECMILETLAYQLCPPTCYSFVNSFCDFLPSRVRDISDKDFERKALFLTELSIMDISFSHLDKSLVAFVAVVHTLDEMQQHSFLSSQEKTEFLQKIKSSVSSRLNKSSRKMEEEVIAVRNMFVRVCHRCDHFKKDTAMKGVVVGNTSPTYITDDQNNIMEMRDEISFCCSERIM